MNSLLLSTVFSTAALAAVTFQSPERPSIPPPAPLPVSLQRANPVGWEERLTAFSENMEDSRQRTLLQINAYERAMTQLSNRCDPSRTYLQTRMQALREQASYARGELVKLPASTGEPDFISAQAHFDRTMNGLHEAYVQLVDEVEAGDGA